MEKKSICSSVFKAMSLNQLKDFFVRLDTGCHHYSSRLWSRIPRGFDGKYVPLTINRRPVESNSLLLWLNEKKGQGNIFPFQPFYAEYQIISDSLHKFVQDRGIVRNRYVLSFPLFFSKSRTFYVPKKT